MTYSQFLSNSYNAIINLIGCLDKIYNALISNYIFKTLIYSIILIFIIDLLFMIYNLLIYIFNNRKNKENKKVE